MAMVDSLPGGAQQGLRIDAAVLVEALVLIGDEHGEEAWVDGIGAHRQAPVAVTGDERAQQLAILVGDEGGIGDVPAERHGAEAPQCLADRETYRVDGEQPEEQPRIEAQRPSAAGTGFHQGAVTVTPLLAVRALRSGRYMSSTVAPGCA